MPLIPMLKGGRDLEAGDLLSRASAEKGEALGGITESLESLGRVERSTERSVGRTGGEEATFSLGGRCVA